MVFYANIDPYWIKKKSKKVWDFFSHKNNDLKIELFGIPQIFKILLLEMTCENVTISPKLTNVDLKSIIFHEKKSQTFLYIFYKFSMGLYLNKIPSVALQTRYLWNALQKTSILATNYLFFWTAFPMLWRSRNCDFVLFSRYFY